MVLFKLDTRKLSLEGQISFFLEHGNPIMDHFWCTFMLIALINRNQKSKSTNPDKEVLCHEDLLDSEIFSLYKQIKVLL